MNGLLHHPSCNHHFRSVMASMHSSSETITAGDPSSPGMTSNTSSTGKSRVASILLHENVGFPDVLPVAIELLDLTMTNSGDERIANCIERVHALVKADELKQDLFGQALINISKARDLKGTIFFRESILRSPKLPSVEELGEFKKSADGWLDKWIDRFKYLGENSDSAEPPGRSLNRHFDDMAIYLTVSDSWLDNVQKAKESLLEILHPQVVRV